MEIERVNVRDFGDLSLLRGSEVVHLWPVLAGHLLWRYGCCHRFVCSSCSRLTAAGLALFERLAVSVLDFLLQLEDFLDVGVRGIFQDLVD